MTPNGQKKDDASMQNTTSLARLSGLGRLAVSLSKNVPRNVWPKVFTSNFSERGKFDDGAVFGGQLAVGAKPWPDAAPIGIAQQLCKGGLSANDFRRPLQGLLLRGN